MCYEWKNRFRCGHIGFHKVERCASLGSGCFGPDGSEKFVAVDGPCYDCRARLVVDPVPVPIARVGGDDDGPYRGVNDPFRRGRSQPVGGGDEPWRGVNDPFRRKNLRPAAGTGAVGAGPVGVRGVGVTPGAGTRLATVTEVSSPAASAGTLGSPSFVGAGMVGSPSLVGQGVVNSPPGGDWSFGLAADWSSPSAGSEGYGTGT